MLTIFAVPKAFRGHFGVIQENAIASWTKLKPKPEVILFGDERGVEKIANKYGLRHIPNVKRNNYGTPILPDVFKKAQEYSSSDVLSYFNCDIILLGDFMKAIEQINLKRFLMIGNRWNLDVKNLIKFERRWESNLRRKVEGKKFGSRQPLDYFVFPKNIDFKMPDFAVGRTIWDNWLVYKAKCLKIPVIDATEVVCAFHQNHDYSHAGGYKKVWHGEEKEQNLKLAGNLYCPFNLVNCDFVLTSDGIKRPQVSIYRVWRAFQALPIIDPKLAFLLPVVVFLQFALKVYYKLTNYLPHFSK